MDSINQQQPEDNHEDLGGADAVERIREVVKKSETCFFCTAVSVGGSGGDAADERSRGRRRAARCGS